LDLILKKRKAQPKIRETDRKYYRYIVNIHRVVYVRDDDLAPFYQGALCLGFSSKTKRERSH
jgi:hypothetical protein